MRAKYERTGVTDKLRELFANLPKNTTMDYCHTLLKKNKLKCSDSVIVKVRRELGIRSGRWANVPVNNGDGDNLEHNIVAVTKVARAVGGIQNLERVVAIIMKAREL